MSNRPFLLSVLRLSPLCLALCLTSLGALAQQAPSGTDAGSDADAAPSLFWTSIEQMGLLLKSIGNLSPGAPGGELWITDVATAKGHKIDSPAALAWPVLAADGHTVYALREGQVVRLSLQGGPAAPVSSGGPRWQKLLGVSGNSVLGLVTDAGKTRPAMLGPQGKLTVLPAPATDAERSRIALMLQENRAYKDGSQLLIKRSTHGGRGYDIALTRNGSGRDLTDCGDDRCGQASLSPDGRQLLYIRSAAE